MDIKKKFKTTCLTLALSLASSFGKAENLNFQAPKDAKTNTSELQADTNSKTKDVAVYFSPKEISTAVVKAGLTKEQAEKFINAYAQHADEKLRITAEKLAIAYKDANIDKKTALIMTKSLTGADKYELSKEEDQQQKNLLKNDGYDYGNYDISFSINEFGRISSLHFSGEPEKIQDLQTINEAMCRHRGLAVDRMEWNMEASQIMTELLVYKIIKEKEKQGDKVLNGEKFIKNFHEKLQKNGLQINKDGKLEGLEEDKNKPLKTEQELKNEYMKKQAQKFKSFCQGR